MNTKDALTVELLGVVPSFKNRKRIGKNGGLFTERKVKARMDAISASIESQLLCAMQHAAEGTLTAQQARSWMLSALPDDDCWTCLPELIIKAQAGSPEDEGATITIERIV